MKPILYSSIFFTLLFGKLAYPEILPATTTVSQKTIVDATWSLYAWQVIGSQYDAPYWTKGTDEKAKVGAKGQTDRDKSVRAICLGQEGNYYVFFTLRSFVDATFPNLFVQGVKEVPLGEDGNPLKEDALISQPPVRYGGLCLTFYEDQGGGIIRVANKVSGITHADSRTPKYFGRKGLKTYLPHSETIESVKYETPHEKISAKEHLRLQKEPNITIRFIEEHDIAILYVPVSIFEGKQISTLGIKNPTLSVKLMLEHNKELFGFKFILIGQETLDLIKKYTPPENVNLGGFQKLAMIAGLALDPETLNMIHIVDELLKEIIPDNLKTLSEVKTIPWQEAGQLALKIVNDETTLTKIKTILISKLASSAFK